MSEAPLIVAAARTPVGTAGHALAGVDAASLAALFDPQRFLVNLGPLFERLDAMEVNAS